MRKFIVRWVARLEHYAKRPWYLPTAAFLAAIDIFVVVIPTDGIVLTTAVMRARHWVRVALWVAAGTAVGTVAMQLALHHWGGALVAMVAPGLPESRAWATAASSMDRYGAAALFLIALGALPMQIGAIAAGLAKMPVATVLTMTLAGRVIRYLVFTWAATHAPKMLERFGAASREAEAIRKADPG